MSRIYQNLGDQELSGTDKLQWEFANESYKSELERKDIGQYVYDQEMSDAETAVWHNHTDKRTHVASRGSTTAYDWGVSDLQIGLGIEGMGSRFKKAERQTKSAHDKYGYTTDVSGHSLAGSVSSHLTQRLGNNDWFGKATTFNSGVSALGKGRSWSSARRACAKADPPAYCNKITHLKEKGDLVSNRNIVCDRLTMGFAPKNCTKTDPFGNTKYYDHKGHRRARDHFTGGLGWFMKRVRPHSLTNFV